MDSYSKGDEVGGVGWAKRVLCSKENEEAITLGKESEFEHPILLTTQS
jgi:hypothetical protein